MYDMYKFTISEQVPTFLHETIYKLLINRSSETSLIEDRKQKLQTAVKRQQNTSTTKVKRQ